MTGMLRRVPDVYTKAYIRILRQQTLTFTVSLKPDRKTARPQADRK